MMLQSRLRGLCRSIHSWGTDFLNLLVPRYCAVCKRSLNTTEVCICGGCLIALPYVGLEDFHDNWAERLFRGKFPVERVHSYLLYGDDLPSRPLVHELKYRHRAKLGIVMGRMMARSLQPQDFFAGIDGIVPVPLHWKRKFRRGYNQSEKLARGVAEVTGLPLLHRAVVRVRDNPTQTRRTARERIENTQSLFRVRNSSFSARHILLIDDVMTTGATLTACATAIRQAIPDVCISVLVLAKVVQ